MEIDSFENENPDARYTFNPVDVLKENLTRINSVAKYINQLKPEIQTDWIAAFHKRLEKELDGFKIDYSQIDLKEFIESLEFLQDYPFLKDTIVQFSFFHLKMPNEYVPKNEETEGNFYDWSRSTNVLKYHRVKAFFDIMDREDGIELWKKLIIKATEDSLESNEEIHPPIKSIADMWLGYGKPSLPSSKYTAVKFDDHKFVLKVDRCPIYDAVKHLNDREAVYLSYCWTGEPEETLSKKSRRKLTPCTLYTSDHCIEFYWNNDVHPDAKPPSDEFWKRKKEGLRNE